MTAPARLRTDLVFVNIEMTEIEVFVEAPASMEKTGQASHLSDEP